ncbi:MAG: hypothetical protein GY756_08805 [bacterium]|nr:hypothetical protein [bacterium]
MDRDIHKMMDELGVKTRLMHVLFIIGDYANYYAAIVVNKQTGKTNSEVMRKIVKGEK